MSPAGLRIEIAVPMEQALHPATKVSSPFDVLAERQLRTGGWSYRRSLQTSVETTALAAMALRGHGRENAARSGILELLRLQRHDGSWPAFRGDSEGSWTTALALSALNQTGDFADAREKALHWLLAERGKEGHWLWRWKFKTTDRHVRFDPDKYGWPWSPGGGSWVIPTALSVIAIKQCTVCNHSVEAEKRIRLGIEMLLDRVCVDGGWNSGNSVVYGVAMQPHVEATAIALLALQNEPHGKVIETSLGWLRQKAATIESVSSLAWSILSLFLYQEPVEELKRKLAGIVEDGREIHNNATLATALLALRCGEMIHPFSVLA